MTRMEPEEEPEPVAQESFESFLRAGIELFDEGRYHEAHEAFERPWLSGAGEDEDFYKGLIQASICLHHFSRGELDGAAKLYSGHRRLLAAYLPQHHSVELTRFLGEMQQCLRPVLRRAPEDRIPFDPQTRPRLGEIREE
ncbi:MAG: DUF309 domain-containing protein [Planctomycetota bacterium]